jgi:hypothetical protein
MFCIFEYREGQMLISWVDCQTTPAKQRQFERQAFAAREWFQQHGPPDAPVLPIGYAERERLKMGGLPHIVAWYARSLAGRKYNFDEHPSFEEFASGVMASKQAPYFLTDDEEMCRRFPPRPLKGLDCGLWWNPPKPQRARPKTRRLRSKARPSDLIKRVQCVKSINTEATRVKVPDELARAVAMAASFYKANEH